MASELDPLEVETQMLLDAADFSNARVLEIGAGDGRLTFRYAKESSFVVGIDPTVREVASAVDACPSHLVLGPNKESLPHAVSESGNKL